MQVSKSAYYDWQKRPVEVVSAEVLTLYRRMKKLNLIVKQRTAYKVTTQRKHSDAVAANLLNQNFNPSAPNEIWAGDVTLYWSNSTGHLIERK